METYQDKIKDFAALLERQQRERFAKLYPNLDPPKVRIVHGKKYVKVDVGSSGKYMVDQEGNIWGIKTYGVIHRGHHYGTLDTIHEWFWGDYAGVKRT